MAWPSVSVEMALGTNPTSDLLEFDRGRFDFGTFAASTPYTDLSSIVRSVEIDRGRQHLLDHYDSGTATVTFDDSTGSLDPNNALGAYYPNVRVGARLRIRYTDGSTTYDRFHGFVQSYRVSYGHPKGVQVVVTAKDLLSVLARFTPAAPSAPQGEGETVALRLDRLCDLAQISESDRDFDAGESTMQATTLSQNLLTEAQLTVDSEGGELYVAVNGKLTFRDRHTRYEDTTSQVVQATFGDAAGEINYESLTLADLDATKVRNVVTVGAAGGDEVTVVDEVSQSRYFDRSLKLSNLIHQGGTTESTDHARRELFFHADPVQRVDVVELLGLDKWTSQWATVLALDYGYRVRVRRRPDSLTAVDAQCFVEGVRERVVRGEGFKFEFRTSPAAKVDAGIFIFDSATLGVLGTNTLAAW